MRVVRLPRGELPVVHCQAHLFVLLLRVLAVNLSQTSILLELERLGIVRLGMVDILDRSSGLLTAAATRVVQLASPMAQQPLVLPVRNFWRLTLLFLLGIFRVAPPVTRLRPRVDHLHLFQPSSHHTIVRVLIREYSLDRRASWIGPWLELRWLFTSRRWTFIAFESLARIFTNEFWPLVLVLILIW